TGQPAQVVWLQFGRKTATARSESRCPRRGGGEEVRMFQGQSDRAASAHREPRDDPPFPIGPRAIGPIDEWDQFLDEEGLAHDLLLGPVLVSAHPAVWKNADHRRGLLLVCQSCDQAREPGRIGILIASRTVQEINRGVALVAL